MDESNDFTRLFTPLDAAVYYCSMGFSPIPLARHNKNPIIKGWAGTYSNRQPVEDELRSWFYGKTWNEINVGIVCGFNNLMILDIDVPELLAFVIPESTPESLSIRTMAVKTFRGFQFYFFADQPYQTVEASGLAELRGKGLQCVAPRSVHPQAATYEWISPVGTPILQITKVEYEEMKKRIELLERFFVPASEIVKTWPKELNVAHNLFLYLSGYLRKHGAKKEEVLAFVNLCAVLSRDTELKERLRTVESTYAKRADEVAGFARLNDILVQIGGEKSEELLKRINHAFGIQERAVYGREDASKFPSVQLGVLIGYLHDNYFIEDDAPFLVTLATAVSNRMQGDPVWLLLVGPPSTIKSEYVRALGSEPSNLVWPLSTLTANTFISGQDVQSSLLPVLNGKIVTIKDLTTILEKSRDIRGEILSQLREIYDGFFSKATGNSDAGYQNLKCRITIIAATTPIIDLYDSAMSLLGDRFVKIRVTAGDPGAVSRQATKAAGHEEEIRAKFHALMMGFLNGAGVCDVSVNEEARARFRSWQSSLRERERLSPETGAVAYSTCPRSKGLPESTSNSSGWRRLCALSSGGRRSTIWSLLS